MQLESHRDQFEQAGVNVAGMTYDSLQVLSDFHAEEELNYPLLKDENARYVSALGILNEDYEAGHPVYGIPHPGVIYIGAQGTIKAKYAIPGYRQRPPLDALLLHIKSLNEGLTETKQD